VANILINNNKLAPYETDSRLFATHLVANILINNNKLAPYETDSRLFATDVSAKFKVT